MFPRTLPEEGGRKKGRVWRPGREVMEDWGRGQEEQSTVRNRQQRREKDKAK